MLGINILEKLNGAKGKESAKKLHAHLKEQLDKGKQVVLYFQPGNEQNLSGWCESGLSGSEQELSTLAALAQQDRYKNIAITVITSLTVAETKEDDVVAAREVCLKQNNISFFDDHEGVAYSRLGSEKQKVPERSTYVFQVCVLNKDSKVIAMLPRQINYLELAIQVAEHAANPVVPIKVHGNLLAPLILYSQDSENKLPTKRAQALLTGINHLLKSFQHIIFLFAHANHYRNLSEAIEQLSKQAAENQTTFIMCSTEVPAIRINFFQDDAANGILQKLWQWHGPLCSNTFESLTKAWVMNQRGELVAEINYPYTSTADNFIESVLTQVPAVHVAQQNGHQDKKLKTG